MCAAPFLIGKEHDDFYLRFSNSLNCLIGGRGTGKSSVLEILEYALSQRVCNERKLDYICRHGSIWVVYEIDNTEYLIKMVKPKRAYPDVSILNCFGQNKDIIFLEMKCLILLKCVNYERIYLSLKIVEVLDIEGSF